MSEAAGRSLTWDPGCYLQFGDLRARPFHELLARVPAQRPRRVVDLGCGPGHLTELLAARWPDAAIEALDSSPDMVRQARERGFDVACRDVAEWTPEAETDVVVCNAVLHWVPRHDELLRRWVGQLPSGGWLALQVPASFAEPSHALPRQLAASQRWAPLLGDVPLLDPSAVHDPRGYAELLADAGCVVDAWETTYLQELTGVDPVLEWLSGTALRPLKSALDDAAWERFRAELAPLLRDAYPPRQDGTTWLPFRRVFAVAGVR